MNMDTPAKSERRAEKLYMENNLLRIAGALFCHDPKRAANRTSEIELNHAVAEKRITIRPDPKLGQPGQLAHKIFVALLKKHSDYGPPATSEISFTRREIGRLIGRKEWGGKDSEQLSRALHEIHFTFVTAHFKNSSGHHVEHSFNIFPQMLIERREFESDPIEACTVTLAEPIVRSLQDEHFVCLNHTLMQQLGTIGQALYMRLFFHFANLYDGANIERLGALGLKVSITQMDVQAQTLPGSLEDRLALQRQVYHDVALTCVRKPACDSLILWGFTDAHTWIESSLHIAGSLPLPYDAAYQPKPAYYGLRDALLGK